MPPVPRCSRKVTWDEVGRGLAFAEFLATLTNRERRVCLSQLVPCTDATASAANGWQLRCRVLKKFHAYFRPDNPA